MALATGAADKGVLQIYETAFRPEEKRHAPWVERCRLQMHSALAVLDAQAGNRDWLQGQRMTQADVTAACVFTFLSEAVSMDATRYPALGRITARCEALPAFARVKAGWFAPTGT